MMVLLLVAVMMAVTTVVGSTGRKLFQRGAQMTALVLSLLSCTVYRGFKMLSSSFRRTFKDKKRISKDAYSVQKKDKFKEKKKRKQKM